MNISDFSRTKNQIVNIHYRNRKNCPKEVVFRTPWLCPKKGCNFFSYLCNTKTNKKNATYRFLKHYKKNEGVSKYNCI